MLENLVDPGVLTIALIALAITGLSVYVSRSYLPKKVKVAYLKSITTLSAVVETKDSGTVGHAQRVARLAVEIAKRLGVEGKDLEQVEYAALIMDMGKANVPQGILIKKEPLTSAEWDTVKSHSRLGAEMAAAVPFLADISSFVLHHHECWDGSGYPDGLTGEQIPLASRILGVAADYDAMASERPYHAEVLSQTEAMEEIRKGCGTKYDPVVGEAFLKMLLSGFGVEEAA